MRTVRQAPIRASAVMLILALASPAAAQSAPAQAAVAGQPAAPAVKPILIKGSLVAVDGARLTIGDAAGARTVVMLADDARVLQLKKIDISAIAPGSYVATANINLPDGSGQSTELRVFAPSMKGLGEGHYAMNDGTGAMMTNGTVTHQVVSTPRGREMDVAYDAAGDKGGKGVRHIVVPPDMVIRSMIIMERSALKPGIAVELRAAPGKDGVLVTRRVAIGENGAPPVT